jgi:urea transporter
MPAEDASGWQEHVRAWLNALAQVAFLDKPVQGALLLAAVGMLSPWSAVGAGLGAAIAVLAGRRLFDQSAAEWASGLGGYDGALVGLAWSGVLARGGGASALFPLAVLACLALRPPIWRLAGKWQLPVLGTPALITVWISVYVFTGHGGVCRSNTCRGWGHGGKESQGGGARRHGRRGGGRDPAEFR